MKTFKLLIIALLLVIIGIMLYHNQQSKPTAVFCSDNASDTFPEISDTDFNLSLKCVDNKKQPFLIDLKNRYSILGQLSIDEQKSTDDSFRIDTIYFSTFQAEEKWGVNIKSVEYESVPCDLRSHNPEHVFTIVLEPSASPSTDAVTLSKNIDFRLGDSYFIEIQGVEGYNTDYLCGPKLIPPLICQGRITGGGQ